MALKAKSEEKTAAVVATMPAAAATDVALGAVNAALAGQSTAGTVGLGVDRVASSTPTGATQSAAAVEQTQIRMKEGVERVMRTAEEVLAFGQGNIAALVRSGQIWVAGLQDLGKQVAATTQGQIADTVTAFKAIAGAKSVKDAIDVQAALARSTIEKTLAESGRITETSLKLTEQALAPVAARVSLAVEKFGRAV